MPAVAYGIEPDLDAAEFRRVLIESGLAVRRPTDDLPRLARMLAQADLVVTTYSLLARDLDQIREIRWARIALDEAQHIKNAATAQARAARTERAAQAEAAGTAGA